MSNFLNFIGEDIEAKKTLLSTMPTNTKTNIRKFNEKIISIEEKYNSYEVAVRKYIEAKSKSFEIKRKPDDKDKLTNNINVLEHVRFILNPMNTYYEKLGFDNLIYEISSFYDFNFTSLIEIINNFLDKFELVGIKLTSNDFNYTYYVYKYMEAFLEIRNKKSDNYENVSDIFEKIYWANPEIIQHIELNFRKLIRKYKNVFTDYIVKLKKEVMLENKINSYDECLKKLKEAYKEFNNADKEDICDIIDMAKKGEIEINNYFIDSKIRTSTYSGLMIDPLNLNDKEVMGDFYESLERLKVNAEEYNNYLNFLPLIDDFKKEYGKKIPDNNKISTKEIKLIETEIINKESKLGKLNKKIFSGKKGLFSSINKEELKQLKTDSINEAKELYILHKNYDQEYFNNKVLSVLNKSFTVSDLLNLYYSFDFFKKMAIKKVFEITSYEEIIKNSDNFDLFAMNLTNVVTNDVSLFEESNLAQVIVNKYRLNNINLNEEDFSIDNLKALLERVKLLLRINEIENSSITIEKIWFMVQLEKIKLEEGKKNEKTS